MIQIIGLIYRAMLILGASWVLFVVVRAYIVRPKGLRLGDWIWSVIFLAGSILVILMELGIVKHP